MLIWEMVDIEQVSKEGSLGEGEIVHPKVSSVLIVTKGSLYASASGKGGSSDGTAGSELEPTAGTPLGGVSEEVCQGIRKAHPKSGLQHLILSKMGYLGVFDTKGEHGGGMAESVSKMTRSTRELAQHTKQPGCSTGFSENPIFWGMAGSESEAVAGTPVEGVSGEHWIFSKCHTWDMRECGDGTVGSESEKMSAALYKMLVKRFVQELGKHTKNPAAGLRSLKKCDIWGI
ncbi:hypothetical protein B0H10DRAFT_1940586 [Mycena sp. CBHHK59/15]|nr:hypothetical protein B0H10DRAFT_1940586 [Mycena sp. CBHHK59/15]